MVCLASGGAATAADKRLFLYNWADFIGTGTIERFEQRTGIKVVYDTYDAEETMDARLLAGESGYDVVLASSNFSGREIKAGVYLPLDKVLEQQRAASVGETQVVVPADGGDASAAARPRAQREAR